MFVQIVQITCHPRENDRYKVQTRLFITSYIQNPQHGVVTTPACIIQKGARSLLAPPNASQPGNRYQMPMPHPISQTHAYQDMQTRFKPDMYTSCPELSHAEQHPQLHQQPHKVRVQLDEEVRQAD